MPPDIKKITDKIDGWLSERERKFLYEKAKGCSGKGAIVEIGSFKGKSTVCLALGSKNGKNLKVYAIDPHISDLEHRLYNQKESTFKIFQSNIKEAGVTDIVNPIVKSSKEAAKDWSRPIEFLWIDGDHSYDGAKTDFDFYSPFVVDGGLIAFHDSTQKEVNRVASDVFKENGFVDLGLIDSITYAKKSLSKKKSAKDKLVLFLLANYSNFRKIKILRLFKDIAKSVVSKI